MPAVRAAITNYLARATELGVPLSQLLSNLLPSPPTIRVRYLVPYGGAAAPCWCIIDWPMTMSVRRAGDGTSLSSACSVIQGGNQSRGPACYAGEV